MGVGEDMTLAVDDDSRPQHLDVWRAAVGQQEIAVKVVRHPVASLETFALWLDTFGGDVHDGGADAFNDLDRGRAPQKRVGRECGRRNEKARCGE
jgi:hypothetical protein